MSDTKELVERLRITSNMVCMGEKISWGQDTALMDEAADAIERLERERGVLAKAFDGEKDASAQYRELAAAKSREKIDEFRRAEAAEAEVATLRARVARLEEALKYIKREAGDRSEKAWFRLDTIMDEADAALTEEQKP